MIILDIKARKINIPLAKPFIFFLGKIEILNYGICEITAEVNGNIQKGIGEFACPWPVTGETQSGFIEVVEEFIRPILRKREIKSVKDVEKLLIDMDQAIALNPSSKASVEMAVLDLLGKEKGAPIHALLGEKKRDNIPVGHVVSMEDYLPELKGFGHIKLKVGKDTEADINRIDVILRSLPKKVTFSLDANEAWKTSEEAFNFIRKINCSRISWIEDPVRDPLELAKLRKKCPVKIMADASLWGLDDAKMLIELKACDLFNVKLHEAGGIIRTKAILDLAEANGIGCIIGSCLESEIGTMASIHAACLSSNVITTELIGPKLLTYNVATGLEMKGNNYVVPNKPGLGID